jgi:site-specific DNA recombinase
VTKATDRGRRAAIYERISSDPTGRAAGVERQDTDCRALAKQLGWRIVAVHRDNDVSAYSGKPRPGYRDLLADLCEGRADAVIAWHPDRLYRRLPDLEELTKVVQENGVLIRTVRAGAVDLNTASGVMTAEILASVSKHEVAHGIERITRAKAQAAAEGRYRGGPRPFGYEADGVTPRALLCPSCPGSEGFDRDRACLACGATAVNEPGSEMWHGEAATDAVISGESLRSVCRTLKEAGVQTAPRRYRQQDGTRGEPESRDWEPPELRKMLLRPRNAGLIEHDGEVVGKAVWPGFVDEVRWRACKDILENPQRRTTTGNGRVWLGSGIYRCWCGSTLKGTTTGTGERVKAAQRGREPGKGHVPAYRCRANAGHVVRRAVNLDQYVTDHAIERLSRPDAAKLLLPPRPKLEPVENFAAQANALRAKLDSIAADYAADRMTRKQMLDATALTRERLAEVEARSAARAMTSVLASLPLGTPDIAEQWDGYHLDKKRAIIDALMAVTVNRARRGRPPGFKAGTGQTYFDEDTIDIQWKEPGR